AAKSKSRNWSGWRSTSPKVRQLISGPKLLTKRRRSVSRSGSTRVVLKTKQPSKNFWIRSFVQGRKTRHDGVVSRTLQHGRLLPLSQPRGRSGKQGLSLFRRSEVDLR